VALVEHKLNKAGGGKCSVGLKAGDNLVRLQFANKVLSLLADLLLVHERELKQKYKEMSQQIERIHGMQMNAKYCGLSGTKHIVFGLWFITYAFLTPRAQMQAAKGGSLYQTQTPITKPLLKKLTTTCQ